MGLGGYLRGYAPSYPLPSTPAKGELTGLVPGSPLRAPIVISEFCGDWLLSLIRERLRPIAGFFCV